MNNGRRICKAKQSCASTQRQSLARGTNNHIFTENGNKYCCSGVQAGRVERGVQSGLYRLKYKFPCKEWNYIPRVLKRAEYAFDRYMDTDIFQHISCARSRVKFKKMEPTPSLTHKKSARYYNGLGFGFNVYLRSHIDRDFTMSIVQAHIDNHDYQVDDRILYYRRIRGVSNMQSKQSRENLTLRRTSLVGLSHIPTLVSALNSTIVFLF
jgi:hypothetical protein